MGLLNLSGHVPANGFWTQLNEERQLLHSIRKRKISYMYYRHITRKTKKKYKDESAVIDQEDDREGGHHWLDRSTNQHGSQGHAGQAQMASCYAHRQPSWRMALDDDDDVPAICLNSAKSMRPWQCSKWTNCGAFGCSDVDVCPSIHVLSMDAHIIWHRAATSHLMTDYGKQRF